VRQGGRCQLTWQQLIATHDTGGYHAQAAPAVYTTERSLKTMMLTADLMFSKLGCSAADETNRRRDNVLRDRVAPRHHTVWRRNCQKYCKARPTTGLTKQLGISITTGPWGYASCPRLSANTTISALVLSASFFFLMLAGVCPRFWDGSEIKRFNGCFFASAGYTGLLQARVGTVG
jgi:hypothetical protein